MPIAPENAVAASKPALSGANDREPNLMRFGLRQLFFLFSAATILTALLARMGGVWPYVTVSVLLLVAAHVFSTFLGTRLRDTSREVQLWKGRPGTADPDEPVAPRQPVCLADLDLRAPPLASHEKIGRWRRCSVAAGAIGGAVLGMAGIYAAAGDDVTGPGLALGAVSCGVIGSWASLLGVNFYSIVRHALRQASSGLDQDHSRR
jgi:hypothetical protein